MPIDLPNVPDVHSVLQPQPELRTRLEYASEPMRQIRGNRATLMEKCVNATLRHAEESSQFGRPQPCGRECFFAQ